VPSSRSRAWIEFDRPDCTMSSRLAGRVMLRFLDQRQEVT